MWIWGVRCVNCGGNLFIDVNDGRRVKCMMCSRYDGAAVSPETWLHLQGLIGRGPTEQEVYKTIKYSPQGPYLRSEGLKL